MSIPFPPRGPLRAGLLCMVLLPLVTWPLLSAAGHDELVLAPLRIAARVLVEHPGLLVLLFLVRLFLLLPVSIVLLLTGALHGPVWGLCLAVAGLTLGGTAEFLLIRHGVFATDHARPTQTSEHFGHRWRARIEAHPFMALLMLRVMMVPFDLVNVAAAWARIPTTTFATATMLGVVPAAFPVIAAGAAVPLNLWLAGERLGRVAIVPDWRYAALAAGALAVSVAAGTWLRRRLPA